MKSEKLVLILIVASGGFFLFSHKINFSYPSSAPVFPWKKINFGYIRIFFMVREFFLCERMERILWEKKHATFQWMHYLQLEAYNLLEKPCAGENSLNCFQILSSFSRVVNKAQENRCNFVIYSKLFSLYVLFMSGMREINRAKFCSLPMRCWMSNNKTRKWIIIIEFYYFPTGASCSRASIIV